MARPCRVGPAVSAPPCRDMSRGFPYRAVTCHATSWRFLLCRKLRQVGSYCPASCHVISCHLVPCLASACIGTFWSHFGVEKTMDKPLPCLAVSRVTLCRVAFGYWLWLWPLLCPEVVGSKFKMEFLHCTWFVSVPCRVVLCRICYGSVSCRVVSAKTCVSIFPCRAVSAILLCRVGPCQTHLVGPA